LMILVTAFAVLLAVLKTLGANPAAFIVITVFVGGIAACQSLLFKGKMPRLASFVGGVVLCCLGAIVGGVAEAIQFHRPSFAVESAVTGVFFALILGGPLGYIVGCFIATIFLVRKEPDDSESTPTSDP
jgi:hypothetical protein